MGFLWKCVTVAIMAALAALLWAVHVRAVVAASLALAVTTEIAIQFLLFFGQLWFVQSEGFWKRLGLTTAGALGAGIGTAVVLLLGL